VGKSGEWILEGICDKHVKNADIPQWVFSIFNAAKTESKIMKAIKYGLIVIGGFVAGTAIIYLMESLVHILYPLPVGIDMYDSQAMKEYVFSMPVTGLLLLIVGYEAGGFVAGFFAGLLSPVNRKKRLALLAGALLTAGVAVNLILITHPLWFTVSSLVVFVPFAWLGAKVAPSLKKG